jgi:hypothetical protein
MLTTLMTSLPSMANTTRMSPDALRPTAISRPAFPGTMTEFAKKSSSSSAKSSPCFAKIGEPLRFVPYDFHGE